MGPKVRTLKVPLLLVSTSDYILLSFLFSLWELTLSLAVCERGCLNELRRCATEARVESHSAVL